MSAVHTAVINFQNDLYTLSDQLNTVQNHWQVISATGGDGGAITVPTLIAELDNLGWLTKKMLVEAADIRTKVQDVLPLVKFHLQDDEQKMAEAQKQLAAVIKSREQAIKDLNAAKAELDGEKGFWNGFLTAITFTAYNPLQANIDKANAAVSRYNASFDTRMNLINALNQHQSELVHGNTILQSLHALDSVFTDYQNSFNAAQLSLVQAHDGQAKAAGAQSPGTGNYYRQRAGKDMDELISWIGTFRSTLG